MQSQRTRSLMGGLLMGCLQVLHASSLDVVTFLKHDPTQASLCFSLTGLVAPHVFMLTHPDRVVIDFKRTSTNLTRKRVAISPGLVRQVRFGYPDTQTLRVVLDIEKKAKVYSASCTLHGHPGVRIDVHTVVNGSPQIQTAPHRENNVSKPPLPSNSLAHVPMHALRDVVVVLDPGHGGKDPGAHGQGQLAEKNIVLAIAQQLKRRIDAQPGMRAVLTRDGDHYLGLRERMRLARKHNADIFVAIHADAFVDHESNGATVFALSQRGATSEAARWLAEKENYSELGGVKLSELDDQNGVIRTVLLDLAQTATIGASVQMGNRVLHELNGVTRLHRHHVEQARFMVLKSPDIPSVLIETGFITNPKEEKNLTNPRYQARLTQAIFAGLKAYFWDHPPRGTRVEAMSTVNRKLAQTTPSHTVAHQG